jgi:hypothetical protein
VLWLDDEIPNLIRLSLHETVETPRPQRGPYPLRHYNRG